ncbi:MAG: hypothetical protein AAFN30_17840 [Actinomycetota bacterium]
MSRFSHQFHLARRFFGSLRPGPPPAAEEAWARARLNDGQRRLWDRLANPDRRHGVEVARAVEAELGPSATDAVLAAALLHDAGKIVSGLGTFGRVGATLFWAVADHDRAAVWHDGDRGLLRRLAEYRLHPELGARLLEEADADPLTATWAREHHLPPEQWTIDPSVAAVLKSCDDD